MTAQQIASLMERGFLTPDDVRVLAEAGFIPRSAVPPGVPLPDSPGDTGEGAGVNAGGQSFSQGGRAFGEGAATIGGFLNSSLNPLSENFSFAHTALGILASIGATAAGIPNPTSVVTAMKGLELVLNLFYNNFPNAAAALGFHLGQNPRDPSIEGAYQAVRAGERSGIVPSLTPAGELANTPELAALQGNVSAAGPGPVGALATANVGLQGPGAAATLSSLQALGLFSQARAYVEQLGIDPETGQHTNVNNPVGQASTATGGPGTAGATGAAGPGVSGESSGGAAGAGAAGGAP
jgi:hypothetical protein